MKKFISLIVIVAFALVLAACGTAMPAPPENSPVIGTWDFFDGTPAYAFNADGTGTMHFGNVTIPIRWSISGNVLRLCDTPDECSRRRCDNPMAWDFMFNEYDQLVLSSRDDDIYSFAYTRRGTSQNGENND